LPFSNKYSHKLDISLIKNHHQKAPFYILHANADAEIAYKQAIKINPNNIDYAFNLSVFMVKPWVILLTR